MYHFGNLLYGSWATPAFGFSFTSGILLLAVLVWSIVWKGLALWKSSRTDSKVWFVVFLIVNTLGILEILYLYVFSGKNTMSTSPSTEEKKQA
jgi:methionyl-tRNA synthetase